MPALLTLLHAGAASGIAGTHAVIPVPDSIQEREGTFRLTGRTAVVCFFSNRGVKSTADYLATRLREATGFPIPLLDASATMPSGDYLFLNFIRDEELGEEGYVLDVNSRYIDLNAHDDPGFFYAGQSLLQLLSGPSPGVWEIPCLLVRDRPRFLWRGMHLDVARHFFPIAFVKRYIDYLAMYKMNKFHWHLTDDQGWRIQIRSHPELTEVAAWRNGSMIGPYSDMRFDSIRYGGYYTQDEIRDVVAYAAGRNVTVVPEIEMPGHSLAALAANPQLSCTGGPFEVGMAWGVYEDVFCPKEETFGFLEDVLTEVCELFPGEYIHIGGDEVPKTRWKQCAACQEIIRREGLRDELELQSYFIRRIERFLNGKGKKIIGWDEILEGGVAPNAAVMSWRGTEGGIAAARAHHNVVMTPGSHCYFDYYQGNPRYEPLAIGGYVTLAKVYSFEPVPAELTAEESSFILGAQGNVWTEYILTHEQVEYMAMPRMLALAEVLWSRSEKRSFSDFTRRIKSHFRRLDRMGTNYSRSLYQPTVRSEHDPSGNGIRVVLGSESGSAIRYTLDGTDPDPDSPLCDGPFRIEHSSRLKAAAFEDDVRAGQIVEQQFTTTKATGRPIQLAHPPSNRYANGDPFVLVDGLRGMPGRFGMDWLGFWGPDLDAVIDLGAEVPLKRVAMAFVEAPASWVYYPRNVEVLVSRDGESFDLAAKSPEPLSLSPGIDLEFRLGGITARYVKVVARNAGKIAEGLPGSGNDAWLFVDELIVE
jgi:hexosaminidase